MVQSLLTHISRRASESNGALSVVRQRALMCFGEVVFQGGLEGQGQVCFYSTFKPKPKVNQSASQAQESKGKLFHHLGAATKNAWPPLLWSLALGTFRTI